jgi:hypothetical protein
MNIPIFIVLAIAIAIPGIVIISMRKGIFKIMIKENSHFSGLVSNTVDIFRIINTFRKSKTLTVAEKDYLRIYLVLTSVQLIFSLLLVTYILINYNEF